MSPGGGLLIGLTLGCPTRRTTREYSTVARPRHYWPTTT